MKLLTNLGNTVKNETMGTAKVIGLEEVFKKISELHSLGFHHQSTKHHLY